MTQSQCTTLLAFGLTVDTYKLCQTEVVVLPLVLYSFLRGVVVYIEQSEVPFVLIELLLLLYMEEMADKAETGYEKHERG